MATRNIPAVIHDFNVYKAGNALIGLSDEITLPSFSFKTDTISGAGLLGEIDESVIGQTGSMEMEISFRTLDDDIFTFMDPTEVVDLNIRAAKQSLVKSTGSVDFSGIRISVRGKLKEFETGTLKQATQMGSKVKLELLYILVEMDGKTALELDKLNSVFKANGVDVLGKVRKYT